MSQLPRTILLKSFLILNNYFEIIFNTKYQNVFRSTILIFEGNVLN